MEVVGVTLGKIEVQHKRFEGVNFPILCDGNVSDQLEKIQNLTYRKGDVFIMSYPRSGTHWVREIVTMLMKGKAEYMVKDYMDFPIELLDIDAVETEASPRVLYSHMPYRYLPKEHLAQNGKVIGCFRDPKDVMASSFHFLNNLLANSISWDIFFEAGLKGDVTYGSWFEWRDQWKTALEQHENNPPLTVQYEEASKNLAAHVTRIAEYLQVTYTDDLIEDIAHACEFKNMKAAKSKTKANMMKRIDEGIRKSETISLGDVNEDILENSAIRKALYDCD
ncbi:sulfotransferase family cytosolic 1B member 1-like isoform X2 [Pecten maximus]|uniref:sulfotransferase family cytosolic 1B member 1-like isoform X2 n=1 Tax=Pecten maximus TaxID=6579 RepID=UPI001457FE11|nr:sulfotransferase family cytosolic 1B member 1-like isoform X2 [Pecten maximus]